MTQYLSKMSSEQHLNDMKKTVLEFIGDLKDNVLTAPEDQGDLVLVEFYFNRMHPLMLMEHIIKHVAPHRQQIESRNVQFFIEQKDKIFANLEPSKVDYFAKMCSVEGKEGIGAENRDVIWAYFDTMLCIAAKYKKTIKRD